jgi:hypothetical protein
VSSSTDSILRLRCFNIEGDLRLESRAESINEKGPWLLFDPTTPWSSMDREYTMNGSGGTLLGAVLEPEKHSMKLEA